MIIAPLIVGLAWLWALRSIVSDAGALGSGFHAGIGAVLTALAVAVAWVVGYLTFFAGGKWLQARSSGNTRIRDAARTPTLVLPATLGETVRSGQIGDVDADHGLAESA